MDYFPQCIAFPAHKNTRIGRILLTVAVEARRTQVVRTQPPTQQTVDQELLLYYRRKTFTAIHDIRQKSQPKVKATAITLPRVYDFPLRR